MTTAPALTDVQGKINEYWTVRAPEYDAYQRRSERYDADRTVWKEAWRGALGAGRLDVLDLGTGSGYVAFLLAELGHRTTGIDLSDGMLEQARANIVAESSTNRPAFLTGDAVDPDFAPASFDAIVGRYVAWTFRDTQEALVRWLELLRPGGTLALADSTWYPQGIAPSAANSDSFIADYYDEEVRAALPLHDADSIEATADLVRAAGFADVTVTPLTGLLELDRRYGVAPHHEVQMQYMVRARRP